MKQSLLYLLTLLFITTFLSCSKDNELTQPESLIRPKLNTRLLSNISKLKLEEDKRLAYSTLSDEDRLSFWKAKISKHIIDHGKGTNEGIALAEIANYLSIDLFKESDEKQIFLKIWLPRWIDKASKWLTKEQINGYIFTLYDTNLSKPLIASLSTTGEEQPEVCHCSVGSNYTCFGPISYHPYLGFRSCFMFAPADCLFAIRGCGAFGDDKCDGNTCI